MSTHRAGERTQPNYDEAFNNKRKADEAGLCSGLVGFWKGLFGGETTPAAPEARPAPLTAHRLTKSSVVSPARPEKKQRVEAQAPSDIEIAGVYWEELSRKAARLSADSIKREGENSEYVEVSDDKEAHFNDNRGGPLVSFNRKTAIFEGEEGLLHANLVTVDGVEIVAAQYPTKEQEFFLRAVFKSGHTTILDLTRPNDGIKEEERYYPAKVGDMLEFGFRSVQITCTKQNGIESTYSLVVDGIKREIKRFHFEGWQDQQGLDHNIVNELVNKMMPHYHKLTVHCRMGVGRTATFIICLMLKRAFDAGILDKENYKEQIEKLFMELKKGRSSFCVQGAGQMLTILHYIESLLGMKI